MKLLIREYFIFISFFFLVLMYSPTPKDLSICVTWYLLLALNGLLLNKVHRFYANFIVKVLSEKRIVLKWSWSFFIWKPITNFTNKINYDFTGASRRVDISPPHEQIWNYSKHVNNLSVLPNFLVGFYLSNMRFSD